MYSQTTATAQQPQNQARNLGFWQTNAFVLLAICCNLINVLYYAADGMPLSAAVNGGGIAVMVICAACNTKGWYETSKFLSVAVVNLHALFLCYIQGLAGGCYLYLFPFVMAMIFLVRIRRNNRQLLAYGGLTAANLLAIVLLLPYESSLEGASTAGYYPHLALNIVLNFLLVIAFFYFVLRLLDAKESRIKNEKKLLDVILNTSLDAVLIADAQTLEVTQYNDRTAELFAISYFHQHQPLWAVRTLLGSKIEAQLTEMRLHPNHTSNWQGDSAFNNGSHRSFHGFVSIVPFTHHNKAYFKISILDITAVRLAEFETIKAREKAEKAAAAKTRFMSNMSHELRTPLNAIIGTTHLLLQEEGLQAAQDHFQVLQHASEHMLKLVNEVLDFNKLDAGKFELGKAAFDLSSTLIKTARSFANAATQKGLHLQLQNQSLPASLPVLGDELRLSQVFLNLLSNAVKFTDTGSIVIEALLQNRSDTAVTIDFSVTDTGIGISAEKLHLIFESFTQADTETTRKYGGSGLGLTICRDLVKHMGGDLQVSSEKDKGSRFYFSLSLPLAPEAGVDKTTQKPQQLEALTGVKVLVAEDSLVNMRIACRFLESWGIVADRAENGQQAWQLFQQNKYDLLLIDLEMPVMDGKQLLKSIRAIDGSTPAIAFTASVYENMYEDLAAQGFTGYIHKPFKPAELHRLIATYSRPKQVLL